MNILVVLIPVSVFLGSLGLVACIWTLRHSQYEDLEGDAARILLDDDDAPRGRAPRNDADAAAGADASQTKET
ncbi:cbb3-type cytochrome oxidase assembly protein CcoS [Roseovarius nanhaiticus]|uniref:cbb3-type cytochrome oxidase assembly protein CcoS n=1 Tax=Roseovarius nanhaiticus TaxID=573024 RepID=UPI0024907A19|nr:cbb3-type cytochrome oxidase assembly protein CcoS [Roseovarius nanhaiticus]